MPTSRRRSLISPRHSAQGTGSFEKRLGYEFSDQELFITSLTHRSAGRPHNERLEFLGDAILGYLIAEALFLDQPEAREGLLTRSRASLVRKETLAAIARELELGNALTLGPGERKSGGRERDSILADAFEALLGAIYLDGGIDAARAVVRELFHARIEDLRSGQIDKDPKTRLQEYLQARRVALPSYEVHDVRGGPHEQRFTVTCEVSSMGLSERGEGASRRHAEQAAALAVLQLLETSVEDEAS